MLDRDQWVQVEKNLLIQTLDHHWKEHLATLDALRQVIHLRSYAQKKPIDEYKQEAFLLFERLLVAIREDVTRALLRAQVQIEEPAPMPMIPPSAFALPEFITHHIDPLSGDDDTCRLRRRRRVAVEPAAAARAAAAAAGADRGRRDDRRSGQPQRAVPLRVGPQIQALPRPGGLSGSLR